MFIKDEKGSFTLEAAIIVPIIVCMVSLFLILTLRKYQEAVINIKDSSIECIDNRREPAEVINNTDLITEYIDKIKSILTGGK